METNDISACERLVMKAIWDTPEEMALQEIMDKVNEENGKSWKPQTVSTFLARLVRKGFLLISIIAIGDVIIAKLMMIIII